MRNDFIDLYETRRGKRVANLYFYNCPSTQFGLFNRTIIGQLLFLENAISKRYLYDDAKPLCTISIGCKNDKSGGELRMSFNRKGLEQKINLVDNRIRKNTQ